MGSGTWSTDVYASTTKSAINSGTTYAHSSTTMSQPRELRKAHATLDPMGVDVRESRDSDEHPTTTPIAVIFDVTGSMSRVPRQLQEVLPELLGQLTSNGYVENPQILFGAVGDATCDAVPLQVGQFESDNRMDEDLNNLVLEAGGGGQTTESYELAMYFMARHTVTDSVEQRGKKGYLFMIGDETAYSMVKQAEVAKFIGDGLQEDIPLQDIVDELKTKWDVYFIIPGGSAHFQQAWLADFWTKLFGQNVILVDSPDVIAKEIALIVGRAEGTA